MEIIINKEAPPSLIQIIHEAYEGIDNIKAVLVDAYILPPGDLAGFEPDTGRVIIDMGHCMTNIGWMSLGAYLIPNAWLNLMLAVHHELVHACQVTDKPELAKLDELPPELEAEANDIAMDAVHSWFKAGGQIPQLENMGWLGEEIAKVLNGIYDNNPHTVLEEMKLLQLGGVANVEKLITSQPHFNDPDHLRTLIDVGEFGLKIGDKLYLRGDEFIAALGGESNGEHVWHAKVNEHVE
jgi:hypothetical protein